MSISKHIPNSITALNLLSGCVGLTFAARGSLEFAAATIWVGAGFDFLDGFTARLLNVKGEFGKQLDSLADMVTFGVLPSFIIYQLLKAQTDDFYIPLLAFLVAIFSALRLAKFNIDEKQNSYFLGLPTPANAIFISSIPLIMGSHQKYVNLVSLQSLLLMVLILSVLLVAPIRLQSLKFSSYSIAENWSRYLLLAVSIVLGFWLKFLAIPIIVVIYLLLSLVNKPTAD